MPPETIPFDRLKSFIHQALTKLGLPDQDARTVAALMAEADLQGSDGHGVSRLRNMPAASRPAASTSAPTSAWCASTPRRRS
jgi:LDH2 family malate/lactate/ureidoglycolate dehydrogenase